MLSNGWNTDQRDDSQQGSFGCWPSRWSVVNESGMAYSRACEVPPQLLVDTGASLSFSENDSSTAQMTSEPLNAPQSRDSTFAPTGMLISPITGVGGVLGENEFGFTSNAWSTTCQRSAINRTPVDCFGDSRTRHGCDYPGCTKTFSRPQDIGRHKLSVHKEGGFRLYCPLVGGDGCSREGGFPRKDKLKDHLLRKHKVSDQELSGLLQESSGSPERPTDTTLASEEAYAPTTRPQEIPSSSKRGVLDQVTSDHAHLGASGDDNAGSLYISPMALQLDHEGSTTGITSNIAAALSSVDLARPSGAISSRNLGSQSYEHHQYPQSTLGRVILAPQPLVHTGRGHTSSPEGPTLRDVRNTAAGSTSNLQKQPRSQTTSLRTAYPGVDLAGLACGSVRRTVGETGATASSSFSQRPQKPFGPSFSSSQWAPTNDFSTERFTFAR